MGGLILAYAALAVLAVRCLVQRSGTLADVLTLAAGAYLAWPAFGGGEWALLPAFCAGWCVMLAFRKKP